MQEQVVACLLALAVPAFHLQSPHQSPLPPRTAYLRHITHNKQYTLNRGNTQAGKDTTREHTMHTGKYKSFYYYSEKHPISQNTNAQILILT